MPISHFSKSRYAGFGLAMFMVLGLSAPLSATPGKTFGAETFTLDNGLQVVVISNHRAPVVHHAVWYRVGAADEPPGKSGIAHMLEHLMFKGTQTIAAGDFSKIVARNGGSDNAFTSHDYTGYFQNIAVDRLPLVMEMEADRMVNLAFGEQDFLTERDVVLEERRSRTDNRAQAQFSEQVGAAQFLSHPYGLPVIGWEHEIRGYTYDDFLSFYRRYYAPNNAILIVAGDITVDALKTLAEQTYGAIPPAADVPPRMRPTEPPQRAARTVVMRDARVASPEWMRSYLAPSYRTDQDHQAIALDVLSTILGDGPTSRLYQSLVVDQQVATGAGAYYSGGSYDDTRFVVFARPSPGMDLDTVEAAVDAELRRLIADGVTDEELERAKFGMQAMAVYSRDSLSTLARIFGVAMTSGASVEDIENWPDLVQAVTADDVADAARAVLVEKQSVTGILLPDDGEAG
jgi:zinc protease